MQAKTSLGLDAVALIVAVGLHLALVAVLLVQGLTRDPIPQPERITVNFAEEVGMTSAAPDPVPESAASVAPQLGVLIEGQLRSAMVRLQFQYRLEAGRFDGLTQRA